MNPEKVFLNCIVPHHLTCSFWDLLTVPSLWIWSGVCLPSQSLCWSRLSHTCSLLLEVSCFEIFFIPSVVLEWNLSSVRVANLDPRSYRIYHLGNLIDTTNYKCLIREWMNACIGLNPCIGLQESPGWYHYLWGTYHHLFNLNSGSPKDRLER